MNPQERAAALSLLDQARQNYNFYGPHAPGYRLKLSFNSNGSAQYEGSGSMEETDLVPNRLEAAKVVIQDFSIRAEPDPGWLVEKMKALRD